MDGLKSILKGIPLNAARLSLQRSRWQREWRERGGVTRCCDAHHGSESGVDGNAGARADRAPDSFLSPDELSQFEPTRLKDAFKVVAEIQHAVRQRRQTRSF